MAAERASSLRDRAATAVAAQQALHIAYRAWSQARKAKKQRAYQAYLAAVARFHRAVADAYPPGFATVWRGLETADPGAIELAVRFLEADPWFFRSGYAKERLLRRLKRVPLTPAIAARLRSVLLAAVDGRDRREFREYCRLARVITTPSLEGALGERLTSPDPGISRRAAWMLSALRGTTAPAHAGGPPSAPSMTLSSPSACVP